MKSVKDRIEPIFPDEIDISEKQSDEIINEMSSTTNEIKSTIDNLRPAATKEKEPHSAIGVILMVIGFGWAALGALNLFGSPVWDRIEAGEAGSGSALFVIMFNMLLFILPGLMVGGIGNKQ